jgi:hypothetical protein
MRRFLTTLAVLGCCVPLAAARRIALIVDTSGSMNHNDRARYAVQISKILSDLTDDQDRVAIIHLPQGNLLDRFMGNNSLNCYAPADRSLVAELGGSERGQFKDRIDQLLGYSGPTPFGPPLRSAIPFLGDDRGVPRLLLLISDAEEGFGNCKDLYTQMLQRFESTGAMVALVKIGGHQDDFAGNPAIQFREDVLDSRNLIGAVAQVYQRFLGSKKVQTGAVSGDISVEIGPHVKEAFLVVAADSRLGQLRGRGSNPQAGKVDLDYRGGGQTQGLDGAGRGYRIIRLTNPAAGRYTFAAPPGTTGGWMLIEDSALTVRLVSQTPVPAHSTSTIQLEVVDETTGKRVTDLPTLSQLTVTGKIGSKTVSLTPNGSGIFTGEHQFDAPATVPVQIRMTGGNLDRTFDSSITVDSRPAPTGKLESQTAGRGMSGTATLLKVKWSGNGVPPDRVIATIDGRRVELSDKGVNGDEQPGDGVYSSSWTPDSAGAKTIHFEAEGGTRTPPVEGEIVVGERPTPPPQPAPPQSTPTPPPPPPTLAQPDELDLGHGRPVTVGRVTPGQERQAEIRLIGGKVARETGIEISTDFNKRHARVEIQTAGGWQPLSATPLKLRLTANDPLRWPVRVHVEKCPEACQSSEPHAVKFVAPLADGSTRQAEAPFQIEILPDPWYVCWQAELLAALSLTVGGMVAYGFISPYRFARRAGVQMAPGEDLSEGFFFPFRAARGSGAGFYRHARLFLTQDFRIHGKRRGGFVRLRAQGNTVRIRPENGSTVWRQQADGSWEPLQSHQETIARAGALYRNDQRTLYFDIRTK